jgi:hypothetical protein
LSQKPIFGNFSSQWSLTASFFFSSGFQCLVLGSGEEELLLQEEMMMMMMVVVVVLAMVRIDGDDDGRVDVNKEFGDESLGVLGGLWAPL